MQPQSKVEKHEVEPKPNLPSVFPFVPPQVDNVFYQEKCDPPKAGDCDYSKPPLMDIPRSYTELEGHYPEEPMTTQDGTNSSSIVYDAPKVVQTWTPNKEPEIPDSSQYENNCDIVDFKRNEEQSNHCDNQSSSDSINSDNLSSKNNQSEEKENIGNFEKVVIEVSFRSVNLLQYWERG